jgi:hypothetical protein
MIVVRNSFIAKPGMAGKLAAQLKEAATAMGVTFRILTDLTGDFNHVVFELESESLTEFETRFRQYGTDPAVREKMAGYTDLWTSGSREIYQVVK